VGLSQRYAGHRYKTASSLGKSIEDIGLGFSIA